MRFGFLYIFILSSVGVTAQKPNENLSAKRMEKIFKTDMDLTRRLRKLDPNKSDPLKFREKFMKILKDSSLFYNPLDSLSREMNIVYSPDKKMRFYSWTSARIAPYFYLYGSYVQIRTNSGKVILRAMQDINKTNSGCIYEVHQFKIDSIMHYVTFSGAQHSESYVYLNVYRIQSDTIVNCADRYARGEPIKSMYNYFGKGLVSRMTMDTVTKNVILNFYPREAAPQKDDGKIREGTKIIEFRNGKYYYEYED